MVFNSMSSELFFSYMVRALGHNELLTDCRLLALIDRSALLYADGRIPPQSCGRAAIRHHLRFARGLR
jgi:hypothetical protein